MSGCALRDCENPPFIDEIVAREDGSGERWVTLCQPHYDVVREYDA